MNAPARAVVFDCDGLLIDSEVRWAVAERRVVEALGGAWTEEFRERLVGGSGEHTALCVAEWVGLPESEAPRILADVYDSYLSVIEELGVEPMPGARSLVTALAGRLPLAVASNTREHMVRATLAASGLPPVFEHVFSPSAERRPKPAPDVYLAACEALGIPPAEAVAFEDSPPGMAAARAAGMYVVGVPSEGVHRIDADLVLGSLLDLDLAVLGAVTAPRVVCAPDKLRGALDAFEAADTLADGVRRAGGEALVFPLADGGEGTLRVVCAAGAARGIELDARDALGRPRRAAIGDCGDGIFLVEAAEAVGLALLAPGERDPRRTSSAGLADLLQGALDRGARHILVALGGSATVDGGLGLLGALGARVPGENGAALLGELSLDLAPARARLDGVELSVLHDVDVPLCGPDGAALLFGPQKGLRAHDLALFDKALERLGAAFGGDIAQRPGAGAAGGLGAALYALGAGARAGSEAVIELVGLREALAGSTLCLTAEGSVDRQSAHGKTVAGVLAACRDAGVPCVVLGGRVSEDAIAPLRALGALDVRAIGPAARPLAVALAAARDELAAAAESAVRYVV